MSSTCKKVCTFICVAAITIYFKVRIKCLKNVKNVYKYKLQIKNIGIVMVNHIDRKLGLTGLFW